MYRKNILFCVFSLSVSWDSPFIYDQVPTTNQPNPLSLPQTVPWSSRASSWWRVSCSRPPTTPWSWCLAPCTWPSVCPTAGTMRRAGRSTSRRASACSSAPAPRTDLPRCQHRSFPSLPYTRKRYVSQVGGSWVIYWIVDMIDSINGLVDLRDPNLNFFSGRAKGSWEKRL